MTERWKARMISKMKKDIHLDVLILMILGTFISAQPFFLISCVYLLYLILQNKMKLIIPNVPGFKLYMIVIIYSALVGLLLYNTRSVIRDLYYVLPTIAWIFIGAFIARLDHYRQKDFFKTLFLYGGFVSIKAIITFVLNFSINFEALRSAFGQNVYDVGFILPIAIIQILFYRKIYINKIIDITIVLLMSFQIVLSLGRIAILEPLLFVFSAMLIAVKSTGNRQKILKKITIVLFCIISAFTIAIYCMPDSIETTFMGKIMNSFTEVDSQQQIDSVENAMNNWRGYEIQAAQEQWKSSNGFAQLFGNGMGKGVEIKYVPYNWENMVENNEIPLLHNGFYTVLIKGGLFGVLAFILMFVMPLYKGIKIAKWRNINSISCILVGASIAAIANTYVVRGPVQQGCFLIWALLIGWIYSYLSSYKKEESH